jgi:hypothetical protein
VSSICDLSASACWRKALTRASLFDLARKAGDQGFSTFLIRDHHGKIEELRRLAGARFNDIELNVTASVVVTDNRREEAERIARGRECTGISADDVLQMPSVFIGSVETIVAEILQRRESFGFSYFAIPDRALAAPLPIVIRLAGS